MRRVSVLILAVALLTACATAPQAGRLAKPGVSGNDDLVHRQKLASGAELIWVDFAAIAPAVDDALAARTLEPHMPRLAELSLARTRITDATLTLCASMPELRRLDLRGTGVTSLGVAALAGHPRLESLVLVETKLSPLALDSLARIPRLKQLSLWRSGLEAKEIATLRERLPKVEIDAGDRLETAVLEEEPLPKLTNEAPVPGGDKPKPSVVNTVCPVSGKPVAKNHVLVDEGKTIGFCCEKCVAAFAAAPEKDPGGVALSPDSMPLPLGRPSGGRTLRPGQEQVD